MIRYFLVGALAVVLAGAGCSNKNEPAQIPKETIPIIKDGPKAGGAGGQGKGGGGGGGGDKKQPPSGTVQ